MIRSLALFTHVVGVLALFVGLGLEWIGLDGIQRSTTRAEALPWLRLIAILVGVAGAACLVPSEAAPPGGGVPAGKVFYTWQQAAPRIVAMNEADLANIDIADIGPPAKSSRKKKRRKK